MKELKDPELVEFATKFFAAYASSASARNGFPSHASGRPFSMGAGGVIELTEEIMEAQSGFVQRAASLLKSKAAHEKAIADISTAHAHNFVEQKSELSVAVAAMIKAVFEDAGASYQYLAPNYLTKLKSDVTDIRVGRVRALRTSLFAEEWRAQYPDSTVEFLAGNGFSLHFNPFKIEMLSTCWVVDVDAVKDNVEEEGKWLIDIAVSYLRFSYQEWQGLFPNIGDVEPHPVRAAQLHSEGAKIRGSVVFAGGMRIPCSYEIDASIVALSNTDRFKSRADILFDAPKKSLAERVSQGLGWLTRGRQSEDRAERLLYFFTAIESLLSTDDKTSPVVQTIARHATVILTADNAERARLAGEIRKLYGLRSSLVHTGNRSVLWSGANDAQVVAEDLFYAVLEKADLKMRHDAFCSELGAASYGSVWPAS